LGEIVHGVGPSGRDETGGKRGRENATHGGSPFPHGSPGAAPSPAGQCLTSSAASRISASAASDGSCALACARELNSTAQVKPSLRRTSSAEVPSSDPVCHASIVPSFCGRTHQPQA